MTVRDHRARHPRGGRTGMCGVDHRIRTSGLEDPILRVSGSQAQVEAQRHSRKADGTSAGSRTASRMRWPSEHPALQTVS
jgi:hypothetical protein